MFKFLELSNISYCNCCGDIIYKSDGKRCSCGKSFDEAKSKMIDDIVEMEEIIQNDVHILVHGSYWVEESLYEYNKRYEIDRTDLSLMYRERYDDYILFWIDDNVIKELKDFIKSKELNIMCSDEFGVKLYNNIHIQSEPCYSIYNDEQDWIDGTYIYVDLNNHYKMFEKDKY